jgi:hypothetical protein
MRQLHEEDADTDRGVDWGHPALGVIVALALTAAAILVCL